jgi:TonB family protein
MRLVIPVIYVLLTAQIALAQEATSPRSIDEAEARTHLMAHSEPVYPPIAKAARVQGKVEIAVTIGANGQITSENVVSGPAMLQQAALDAVRKWTFTPFLLNGVAVPVNAKLAIPFQIDKPGEGPTREQQDAAQAWFPVSDKCLSALLANKKDEAFTHCKQALDLALKAGDTNSSDQIGIVLSHQYYGHALLLAGNLKDALAEENDAVEEAKKCFKTTDQEYAMPFFWRAMVEANLGQVEAVFSDLQIAEEAHRRAIAHLPDMKQRYSETLARILRQHAVFLDQQGRPEEAAKLRAEAGSL